MRGWEGVQRARRALCLVSCLTLGWEDGLCSPASLSALTHSLALSLTFFCLISLSSRLALACHPVYVCESRRGAVR